MEIRDSETSELISLEVGAVRCKPCDAASGKIEVSLVHVVDGTTELAVGNYSDDSIEVTCRNEGLSRGDFSAQPALLETRRVFQFKRTSEGKSFLEILVEKATTECPMQSYLVARLFQIRK